MPCLAAWGGPPQDDLPVIRVSCFVAFTPYGLGTGGLAMKIAVLGTGEVGRVLGAGFVKRGHEVMIGSRDPSSAKVHEWLARTGAGASAGTFAEAAKFGEVAVLATLWAGTENALRMAGTDNLAGKVVIDATNPLDFTVMPPRLAIGHTDSGGEQVQRWLQGSRVVKAYNTVGNPHMINPEFPGGPPDMFICGNDDAAKRTVCDLLGDFGWPCIDLGGIEASRYLEPLAMVWILHYIRTSSGNHAFKLLKK
jgi:predicted dinucleotide-binding enzyme